MSSLSLFSIISSAKGCKHCRKETAEKIVNNGGDCVLQLKTNQGKFYEDVYAMFEDKYMDITDKDCEYET